MPDAPDPKWAIFSDYLDRALELSEADLPRWLAALRETDPDVAKSVEDALSVRKSAGFSEFLAGPSPLPAQATATATLIGRRVGPYEIDAEIGRGGMGSVWRAHRADGRYQGVVAIKFVHAAWIGQTAEQRFHLEGQALGQLNHPNIARLLDAGVLDGMQPYLILEYVEGEPIDAYCERHRLGIDGRIRLFLSVLGAVADAHRHLIVHRDLKPANVFVTRDGTVKLLDFGIAKLLDAESGSAPLTQSIATALTPHFAAPEQLLGQPITTATDVYALGLILYVLLTGRHPISSEAASRRDLLHSVLRDDPPRPSLVTAVPSIRPHALQGDLDNIVAKALKKAPIERYATAEAFAADLGRYLSHEPVHARPDAISYRVRKLIRRHRLPVVAAAIVTLALVAGVVATSLQATEARRQRAEAVIQRERAERESTRATAVKNFLVSIFRASDPKVASDKPRGQITARELLDLSSERIERQFAAEPDTELELLRVTSNIYYSLGDSGRAAALRKKRVALARALHGELNSDVIDVALDDVHETIQLEKYAEAVGMLERPDRMLHEAGLDRSALRARWWFYKGETLWSRSDARAVRVDAFRQAASLYAAVAPHDTNYPLALQNIAVDANAAGDYQRAREYYERALAAAASTDEPNDENIADMKINFAITLQRLGDFAAAEQQYEGARAISLRTHGEQSPAYWDSIGNEANMLHQRGSRERADRMFADLLPHIPPDWTASSDDAFVYEYYGAALAVEGRPTEGVRFLERAEKIFRERPMDEYDLPRVRQRLGDAYDRAGRTEEARRMLRSAYEARMAAGAADGRATLDARERWGRFLLAHAETDQARAEFEAVVGLGNGRDLAAVAMAHGGLGAIAAAAGDLPRALAEVRQGLAMLERVTGIFDVRYFPYLWRIEARVLLLTGDAQAARTVAAKALAASSVYDTAASPAILEARSLLAKSGELSGNRPAP